MSPKSLAFLTVLFVIVLLLNIWGQSEAPLIRQNQTLIQTPKPVLLPLDYPISLVRNFLSPSPSPSPPPNSPPVSQNTEQEFESVAELEKSLNLSLDLTGSGTPFGGRVLNVQSCDLICGSPYEMIIVGPPVGGTYLIGPTTTVYREFDYSTGHWVLGLAGGTDVCLILVFEECVPIGAGPVVEIMGTSN